MRNKGVCHNKAILRVVGCEYRPREKYNSRLMGKPTICIGENKDADQLQGNREADQRLCFRYSDSKSLFYLNPKFQASSSFLCLYRLVCVGPVRKPHCWFSHEAAHMSHKMETTFRHDRSCSLGCKAITHIAILDTK